jgi:transcriptional regulator with XRE-family HTH domain
MRKHKHHRPRLTRETRPSYPNLRAYLDYSSDTQADVARQVGTSQAQISRFTKGDGVPRPALAAKIAEYCNIPLDSFQRVYLARQLLLNRRSQTVA